MNTSIEVIYLFMQQMTGFVKFRCIVWVRGLLTWFCYVRLGALLQNAPVPVGPIREPR